MLSAIQVGSKNLKKIGFFPGTRQNLSPTARGPFDDSSQTHVLHEKPITHGSPISTIFQFRTWGPCPSFGCKNTPHTWWIICENYRGRINTRASLFYVWIFLLIYLLKQFNGGCIEYRFCRYLWVNKKANCNLIIKSH